jgi:hypothetical protein
MHRGIGRQMGGLVKRMNENKKQTRKRTGGK